MVLAHAAELNRSIGATCALKMSCCHRRERGPDVHPGWQSAAPPDSFSRSALDAAYWESGSATHRLLTSCARNSSYVTSIWQSWPCSTNQYSICMRMDVRQSFLRCSSDSDQLDAWTSPRSGVGRCPGLGISYHRTVRLASIGHH